MPFDPAWFLVLMLLPRSSDEAHVERPTPVADADGLWVDKRRGALPAGPVWLEPW